MHTSKVLKAGDFTYWSSAKGELAEVEFDDLFPDYQSSDRIAVVSPQLEDGVLHVGYALLAATTRFYDMLREQGEEFYDYPHHFGFFDVSDEGVSTRLGRVEPSVKTFDAWSGLDVWPKSQWIHGSGSVESMIDLVFTRQINCLFWPESLQPSKVLERLPVYVRPLLEARLKTIYLYNSDDPDIEIHANAVVEDMVQKEGRLKLPIDLRCSVLAESDEGLDSLYEQRFPYVERYRRISVEDFLDSMSDCFTLGEVC